MQLLFLGWNVVNIPNFPLTICAKGMMKLTVEQSREMVTKLSQNLRDLSVTS